MRLTVRYVHPHPKTGRLQYRRRVPKTLREVMGCTEIIRRLDTQDPMEAARRAEIINKEVEREFARLQPTANETPIRVYGRVLEWLQRQGYAPGEPRTDAEYWARDNEVDRIIRRYQAALGREPEPEELADEDLFKIKVLYGDLERPPLTIRDALQVYLDEKGQGQRNDREQRRFVMERERCVNMLVEVIGNKPVAEITRSDARAYRDFLINRLNSIASVNKYLRNVRAIFETAITETEIDKTNPFAKLQVHDPVAAREKRNSFSADQLRTIVHTAHQPDALRDDLRRILLLLVDTGARLWEVVGLETADVVLSSNVPHLLIRPNDIRALKTKASKRRVPLIGYALQAAREAVAAAGEGPALFPAYAHDKGNTNASAALNKFLGNKARVKAKGLTIHSLRHTFKDRMRNVGIPEDVRDAIQGHENGKVSADYGDGYGLEYLAEQLERVWASSGVA